jgi:dTDP-4-amino-4,6-dideoxygalactose transaminase
VQLCYGARQALYLGARSLGLRPGDRVLVPAYACGTEIDALLKAGITALCYRIRPDLSPDFEHLEELLEQEPRALLVTHYFGFAQRMDPIVAFAADHDLLLIEDNAHGLYATDERGRPLGGFGDLAVFSLTKSLPLPDGGVMLFNRPSLQDTAPETRNPSRLAVARRTAAARLRPILATLGRRFPSATSLAEHVLLRPAIKQLAAIGGYLTRSTPTTSIATSLLELKPKQAEWGMSSTALSLLRGIDHASIAETRRRNFRILLQLAGELDRVTPLFSRLPAGACPLVFPLEVVAAETRPLESFLGARGVTAVRIWCCFHDRVSYEPFPFESRLKRGIVALPVHQDLTETEMAYIADLLRVWSTGRG